MEMNDKVRIPDCDVKLLKQVIVGGQGQRKFNTEHSECSKTINKKMLRRSVGTFCSFLWNSPTYRKSSSLFNGKLLERTSQIGCLTTSYLKK